MLSSTKRRWLIVAILPILALGVFQFVSFGSPFKTGYHYWLSGVDTVDPSYLMRTDLHSEEPLILRDVLQGRLMEWMCPCSPGGPQASLPSLLFYPLVLLGVFWIFAPPLTTIPGLFYIWRNRRSSHCKFALYTLVFSLATYFFYFHQASRFMVVPATTLIVFSGVAFSASLEHISSTRLAKRWNRDDS
jgi:hypothetical protein